MRNLLCDAYASNFNEVKKSRKKKEKGKCQPAFYNVRKSTPKREIRSFLRKIKGKNKDKSCADPLHSDGDWYWGQCKIQVDHFEGEKIK